MYNKLNAGAFNAYKETRVKTASQARLIVMLYDEMLKQIDLVIECCEQGVNVKDYEVINTAINKAQSIIGELMSSLDFEKGGDIAPNLFHIYQYFNVELTEANLAKKVGNLVDVRQMVNDLREAWNAIDSNKSDPKQEAINIAG
ncbi:MAG: flagellar export chaperone FliS [Spirochaetaceae bacterium]|nr:flagellar export chaperone FliS [Spirochaetaceae bacterium]